MFSRNFLLSNNNKGKNKIYHKPQQTRSTSQSESNGKEARLICVDCTALEPLRLPDSFLSWHLYLGSEVGRPPFGEHFLCFRFCPCMVLLPAPTFKEKKVLVDQKVTPKSDNKYIWTSCFLLREKTRKNFHGLISLIPACAHLYSGVIIKNRTFE